LQDLDAAVAEVVRNLDVALASSTDRAGEGSAAIASGDVGSAARALRAIVTSIHSVPGARDRKNPSRPAKPDLVARARAPLETFACEAKAERRRAADQTANTAEWERHAKLAVHAPDTDLAREALGRRAECARLATCADLLDAEHRLMVSALEGDAKQR
jgi:hypothetical protein